MQAPSLLEVQAERARRSLHYFVRSAWGIVEPEAPFVENWHIGLICEYLEALQSLQIQNLIINIPPGYAKSLLCSVMFPAWVWTKTPEERFLTASHGSDLAMRDAVRSRRLIKSNWYQDMFGDKFQMSLDQDTKSRYENDKGGHRVSVGAESGITGFRGNYIVWDDPLDAKEKESKAKRDAANDAVASTMGTRGANPSLTRRLLIMQRLHQMDPTGYLLKKQREEPNAPQFEHLVLPARYEPNRFFSGIGKKDPRTEPGELLFPKLFPAQAVAQAEALLGELDAAGQLQQRPVPEGGSVYLAKWWQGKNRYYVSDESYFARSIGRWLSWDTALKDNEQNDYTALAVADLLPDYRLLLRFAWWRKLQFPQLVNAVQDEMIRWNYDGKLRGVIIEDKGSGTSAIQTLRQGLTPDLVGLILEFKPGSESKLSRNRQASMWCDRDCVLLPNPEDKVLWLMDFEEAIFNFPNYEIDDPADAFAQVILYLENLLATGWRARTGLVK